MGASPTPLDPLAVLTDSLRRFAQRGEPKRLRKGHLLIEEGEQGDTLFIIPAGRVRVFGSGRNRDCEITYGLGEYVRKISLDGGPRSANVEACEAGECAVVTKQSLRRRIAEHLESPSICSPG